MNTYQATHHHKSVLVAAPTIMVARIAAANYFHTHKPVPVLPVKKG